MKKKISDLFDYGDEIVITDEISKMFDPKEIKELTMNKIHTNEETPKVNNSDTESRKRLSKAAVVAIVAAACLALSGAAYAVGFFWHSVNWKGKPIEQILPDVAVTSSPIDPAATQDTALDEAINEIFVQRKGRELIIVRNGSRAISQERTEPLSSAEELAELLKRESSPLIIPVTIPDGYSLFEGRIGFSSATGYGYSLDFSETRTDGLEVEHYSAPSEGDFISSYALTFENEKGNQIIARGDMGNYADMGFGVFEDGSTQHLTIDGMEDGVEIDYQSEGYSQVYLHQVMQEPMAYVDTFSLMDSEAPDSDIFADIMYSIYAEGLSVQELQTLLGQ